MKFEVGSVLEVTWIDACGKGGWQEPYSDGVEVKSVGYLVNHNKKGICLASGIDPTDEPLEKAMVLAPGWIPKGMVKKIRRLR